MAFDINARLRITGVTNLNSVANDIRRAVTQSLQNVPITVTVNLNGNALNAIQTLNGSVAGLANSFSALQNLANQTGQALSKLYQIQGPVSAVSNINNYGVGLQQLGLKAKEAAFSFEQFGQQAGLAVRRFLAFSIAAGGIISFISAVRNGIQAAVQFNSEMIKVAQVSDEGGLAIGRVSSEIDRVSTTYGVSSLELAKAAVIIKQAGFTSEQTAQSIQVLAQAALSPNFGTMEQNVRGLVAVMGQFKLTTTEAAGALNAINAVAAATTVDAKDIVDAITKAGGAFATVGGDYREFIAIFSSIKDVTQESAESIGTGLRTIFARLQDPANIAALRNLGIELRRTAQEADVLNRQNISDGRGGTRRFYENQFVGPNEAIRRIQNFTSQIDPNSPVFSDIVGRLGGQRQISRVLPLLQQGEKQSQLLNIINASNLSLENNKNIALDSIENQIGRVNEKFLSLFRTIGSDRSLNDFRNLVIGLTANIGGLGFGLLDLTKFLTPLVPLFGALAATKVGLNIVPFLGGIGSKFGLPSSASFQYPQLGYNGRLNNLGTPTITGGGTNLSNVQLTDVSAQLYTNLKRNPQGSFVTDFRNTLRRDIEIQNPRLNNQNIDILLQNRVDEIQQRLQSFQDNRKAIRELRGILRDPKTPNLQRIEASQRLQELYQTQSTIQQQTGIATDAAGNFVGIGGTLFRGSRNQLTDATFRDRRNLGISVGASLAGGAINGITSYTFPLEDSIRSGNTTGFVAGNTLGSSLTGAGLGYGVGASVAVSGGPIGAVIGAVVIGLQSFLSSLEEVRKANIAKIFQDLAGAQLRLIEALEKGNFTARDISENQRLTSESIRQNVYLRENTLESFLAYPNNQRPETVESRGGESTRLALQQIYSRPELVRNNTSLIQRELARILRNNFTNTERNSVEGGQKALERINDPFYNNPYRNNLRLLSYSQGFLNTNNFIQSPEGRRLAEQTRLNVVLETTARQFNSVNNDLLNFSNGIKGIIENVHILENSINSNITVSQGNFSNIRVPSQNLENLLGSGELFNSLQDLPREFLTPALRDRLRAIDAVSGSSSIVARDLSRRGFIPANNNGDNFAGYISNQIQNQNPNAFNTDEGRRILTNVRDRLAARFGENPDRQQELINNPEELQQEINNVFRDVLRNVQNFADNFRQQIQREIQLRNDINKFLLESIGQERLANNARLDAIRQSGQFSADNQFRTNENVRFISQSTSDNPFNQQLRSLLSRIPGAENTNPNNLGRLLNGLNSEYNSLSGNPSANANRLTELNNQIVRVTQALRLYGDAQSRTTFLIQRYNFLQEERQGRINFARTALFADDNQRYELNRGFNLLQNVLASGNLNLNQINNDTDRRSLISFLDSVRGISFNTANGPQRAENIQQQLLASLYGGNVLPNGAQQELEQIQREIVNRMNEAATALSQIAQNTRNQTNDLNTTLTRINQQFLTDLRGLLSRVFTNATGNADGGPIYAATGSLVNFKPKGTDTIPAMLTKGEYVVNAEAVRNNYHLIDYINKTRKPIYRAEGGLSTEDAIALREFQIQIGNERAGNRDLARRRNPLPKTPLTISQEINPLQAYNRLSGQALFLGQIASQTSLRTRNTDFSGISTFAGVRQSQLSDVAARINYKGRTILSQLGRSRDDLDLTLLNPGEIARGRAAEETLRRRRIDEENERRQQAIERNRRRGNPVFDRRLIGGGDFDFFGGGINTRRFNFGGAVLGGDIVPSYLQNGEYVVNREQVNRIGAATLQSLGTSSIQSSTTNSPVNNNEALVQAFNLFSQKTQPLVEAFNLFNKNADRLSEVFSRIPTSLSIEGKQTVEVLINGAQVMTELNPIIKDMISKETVSQLQRLVDNKFPTL